MDYKYFKQSLIDLEEMGDPEIAHGAADELLCCIAEAAAKRQLTVSQTKELISLYRKVEKWFA